MLFGEHAVLRDKLAIACAIDARITLTLKPHAERTLKVISALGCSTIPLRGFIVEPHLRFLLWPFLPHVDSLPSGATVEIVADMPPTHGLGTSAAVAVIATAALHTWQGISLAPEAIFAAALIAIRGAQRGVGSGSDLAASLFGGVVAYRMQPFSVRRLAETLPLVTLYSGSKTPTPEVIALVAEREKKDPQTYQQYFEILGAISEEAAEAISQGDLRRVGELMGKAHAVMHAMQLSNEALERCLAALNHFSTVFGAKISGSGLGDCAVGLGECDLPEALSLKVTERGLQWH